jgi:hypothetical protein
MATQYAKHESKRLIAWSPNARTPERHAAVAAAFKARWARDTSHDHTIPDNLPARSAEAEAQYRQALGHLDRVVKLRENREAKAAGLPAPHKIKRLKREQVMRDASPEPDDHTIATQGSDDHTIDTQGDPFALGFDAFVSSSR